MQDAHQPLLPLGEAELARVRENIEKGRAPGPDIRPGPEKNQSDISTVTRDIARSS